MAEMHVSIDPLEAIGQHASILSYFDSRDSRITHFRDLVKQIDWAQRKKSSNYASFEGNEAGSFFSAMVQILSKNPMRHRIPLEGEQTDEERDLVSKVERLVLGTYRDVDDLRTKRMEAGPMQQAMSQFACSDGWVVVEVVKNDDNSEKPLVDMRTHDNLLAHPVYGPDGLLAVYIRSDRTKAQVQLEYPQIKLEQRARLFQSGKIDYVGWGKANSTEVLTIYQALGTDIYYGVAINAQWAIKPYKLDWINEIPVVAMPINGLPFRTDRRVADAYSASMSPDQVNYLNQRDWLSDVGRGIFHMNEGLYPAFNELWANIMDIVDKEARGTYNLEMPPDADDDVDTSGIKIGKGGHDAINALPAGSKLTVIPPIGLRREVVDALNGMSGMLQRGGISWQLTGSLPPTQMSGFALSQLLSAALTIANPYVQGLQGAYAALDGFIIKAYQKSTRQKQTVKVMKSDKSFVVEEIDLSLLKGRKFYFDVQLKPALPDDIAQKVTIAATAKRDGLLSNLTIMDDLLGVDDPETELDRKLEDDIMSLPTVRLRRAAGLALERGDRASAIALLMELQILQATKGVQLGQAEVQLQQMEQMLNPNQGADTGMGGVGGMGADGQPLPANPLGNPTGVPSSVVPPEMTGISPQAQRSMATAMVEGLSRRGVT